MAETRCGAKKRSGDTCRQAAGWGTDHPGEGKCKLHGGSTPIGRKGEDHPNYRHGLYAQHASAETLARFEAWRAQYHLAQVSEEETYGIFRVLQAICGPGPLPMMALAGAMEKLANLRLKYKTLVEGQVFKLELTSELDTFLTTVAEILVKYVPEDQLPAALDELEASAGGVSPGETAAAAGGLDAGADGAGADAACR